MANNTLLFTDQQTKLHKVLTQRAFIIPSFEIYNGVSGFYDLGPPGCALKNNILTHWRNSFIVEEDMLEIECSQITPAPVLKSSGHVERFTDIMIKDNISLRCLNLNSSTIINYMAATNNSPLADLKNIYFVDYQKILFLYRKVYHCQR